MSTTKVTTDVITDNAVTAAKLAGTLDLSSKSVTLANGEISAAELASSLDLSGKTLTLAASQKAVDYLEYREEQAANTQGGTFTSGAWRTRVLNTEVADTGNNGALSSNQITLAAGTYECYISAPGVKCDNHKAKLYNVTDAADTLIGTSEWAGSGSTPGTRSIVSGRFTIAGSKVFEVRHQCGTTFATSGLGEASNFGVVEVYTVAQFWKVA